LNLSAYTVLHNLSQVFSENPANWSCGLVPDMYTDVIINSGSTVVINSNVTVATMQVATSAVFTVNTGFTVTLLGH